MNTNSLWFLAIFFAMSIGSWVLGQLREQAKLKKTRDESKRQYEEQLRTGRAEPARGAAGPTAQAMDLAERRQAQLRELRRQQESSRGGVGAVVARPTGTTIPATPRPVPVPIVLGSGGMVIQRGPMMPRPQATPGQRRESAEAEAAQAAAVGREAAQHKRLREQAAHAAAALRTERAEAEAAKRRVVGVKGVRGLLIGSDGRPVTRNDLRRLFALNEILGKPVSMRGGESE